MVVRTFGMLRPLHINLNFMSEKWLIFIYKLPPEPAKKRVALWRKLKSMGAIYVQSGVCILPKTDEHTRRLKIIEHDLREASEESLLLETVVLDQNQARKITERFCADRNEEYGEFIDKCKDFKLEVKKEVDANHLTYAELEENDVDLKKLQQWFEKIQKLDFYSAPLRPTAKRHLQDCEQLLDDYAQRVFEAHEENQSTQSKENPDE